MVNASTAFLFPGQGSQHAGMLARLLDHDVGRAACAEAQQVLDRDLRDLDSLEALAGTEAAQIALLIAGVAGARVLEEAGIAPAFVAGHSVGAFAAATHARVLDFSDALRLVALRGHSMAQAYAEGYGMAAVAGVRENLLMEWIDATNRRGARLYLANRNTPTQFTVSGSDADLDALIDYARRHGASKAVRLAVAVPSHSPFMSPVAETMRKALRDVPLHAPRFPYAANRSARILDDAAAIADDLADGVEYPVRWHEITIALYERGVRFFVEMPPGDVLTRLTDAAFDDARAVAVESTGIETIRAMAPP